jgi:hypothetical protein
VRATVDTIWRAIEGGASIEAAMDLTGFPSGEGKWQLTRIGADWPVGWNAAAPEPLPHHARAELGGGTREVNRCSSCRPQSPGDSLLTPLSARVDLHFEDRMIGDPS